MYKVYKRVKDILIYYSVALTSSPLIYEKTDRKLRWAANMVPSVNLIPSGVAFTDCRRSVSLIICNLKSKYMSFFTKGKLFDSWTKSEMGILSYSSRILPFVPLSLPSLPLVSSFPPLFDSLPPFSVPCFLHVPFLFLPFYSLPLCVFLSPFAIHSLPFSFPPSSLHLFFPPLSLLLSLSFSSLLSSLTFLHFSLFTCSSLLHSASLTPSFSQFFPLSSSLFLSIASCPTSPCLLFPLQL